MLAAFAWWSFLLTGSFSRNKDHWFVKVSQFSQVQLLISPAIKLYLQQCILQLFYNGQDPPSKIVLLPIPHQDFTLSVLGVPSPVRPLPSPSAFQQWPTQIQSWYQGRGWWGCSHLSPRGSRSRSSVLGGTHNRKREGQSPAQRPQLPQRIDLPDTGRCRRLPAGYCSWGAVGPACLGLCTPVPPRNKQHITACSPQGAKWPTGSSSILFTWYGKAPLILQAHQEALAVPVRSREVTFGSQTAVV